MPSGTTLAKRPITYNGQNLSSAPIAYPSLPVGSGGQFSISDAISAAQQGQNAANAANNTRYNQGLGVLTGGANQSAGFIQNAMSDLANLGDKEKRDIARQETNAQASQLQSNINRGIGNTTIQNTLANGITRNANEARLNVDDMIARNRSNLNLQAANNASGNANSISSFIASRNDNAPSLGEYANLVQQAAQYNPTHNVGTVTSGGGINAPINIGSKPTAQIQAPVNQGAAIGTYFNKAATGGFPAAPLGGTDMFADYSGQGGRQSGVYTNPNPLTFDNGVISNALNQPTKAAGKSNVTALPDQPDWMTDDEYWQMLQQTGQYGN